MDLAHLYRKTVLTIAANRAVTAFALKAGMKMGAARFVASESLEQALTVVADLNRRGIMVTLDHLGEGVHEESVARGMCQAYLELLDGIARTGADANVSLKLTQMGLSFDRKLTDEIMESIVRKAAQTDNFVRIDMEDTPYVDATLGIYYHLRKLGFDNVGVVVQSYLYRTEQDVADLDKVSANLRLVKGAYKEPPDLAYQGMPEIRESFKRIVKSRLSRGLHTAIATHDESLVAWAKEWATEQGLAKSQIEFQMLYGVRMNWQEELAREGYKVRCYVPYGKMWYPYFTRRIAERPDNLSFIIKNMFKG